MKKKLEEKKTFNSCIKALQGCFMLLSVRICKIAEVDKEESKMSSLLGYLAEHAENILLPELHEMQKGQIRHLGK